MKKERVVRQWDHIASIAQSQRKHYGMKGTVKKERDGRCWRLKRAAVENWLDGE